MCRNIKMLHNFNPPSTEEEIRASSLQFVRKLSGFTRPSKANEQAFTRAVDGVTQVAQELLNSLVTNAPPRDREVEALKARTRSAKRFGSSDVAMAASRLSAINYLSRRSKAKEDQLSTVSSMSMITSTKSERNL
jgi:hypothetical protein